MQADGEPHHGPLVLGAQTTDYPTDSILKTRAHAAFVAYDQAIRDGDDELAAAARDRFLSASAALSRWRRCRLP